MTASDGQQERRRDPPHHLEGLTQQNIRDIGEVRSEVAGVKAAVKTGFDSIGSRLDAIGRPKQQGQGIAISALVVSVLVALSIGVSFAMDTIKESTSYKFAGIEAVLELRAEIDRESAHRSELDDARELIDAYSDGKRDQKITDTSERLSHIDSLIHTRTTAINEWILQSEGEMASTTAGIHAMSDYIKEHAAKQGSAGHPAPERVISGSISNLVAREAP